MALGRPSDYNDELASDICQKIANGQALSSICDGLGMPTVKTVMNWLEKHPDFLQLYARAREVQGDLMDELIMATATAAPVIDPDGRVDNGDVAHRRLKIDALKWRAAHLRPKVYGLKQVMEHTGKITLEQSIAQTINEQKKLEKEASVLAITDGEE